MCYLLIFNQNTETYFVDAYEHNIIDNLEQEEIQKIGYSLISYVLNELVLVFAMHLELKNHYTESPF